MMTHAEAVVACIIRAGITDPLEFLRISDQLGVGSDDLWNAILEVPDVWFAMDNTVDRDLVVTAINTGPMT